MVNTKLVISYPFTNTECKELEINDSSDLNGFYNYKTDQIYIVLGSKEFSIYKSSENIINLFTKVVTHELLHGEIYKVTNKYMNETEDKLVIIMAGQDV